jgi:ABC-type sugar transport system permease subunit
MFESMKIGTEITDFVVSAVSRISSIIDRCGVQMLILLAALQSISPAIYESCSIDGATTWETFWKITLPMISPMILVATVYTVIDSFTSESNQVMRYIEKIYNEVNGNVLSAAMAWIYFAIVILIVLGVVAIMSAFVFYQRRD